MATMYNKTALNKIKKADLIALFLEQQAEKNQLVLDAEEMNQKGWLEIAKREEEFKKLQEENKKLNQLNDYAYKQLNELMSKVTLLTDEIEKLKESDSESDEECDQCVCCEVKFDQHEARYNMGEDLRLKYQKYFGSEKDDGDICPECLNLISD
jgi:uncharacterized phage infection (PIP) family protein YhgE